MIFVKAGVRLHGIKPEIILAMVVADGLLREQNKDLVITSVIDGQHMRASIHYVGGAFDFRTNMEDPEAFRQKLHNALGGDYDVVLEEFHMHVEWQPKEAYS